MRTLDSIQAAWSSSRVITTPATRAIASRVRSSWVGPMPPVRMMASAQGQTVPDRRHQPVQVVTHGDLVVGIESLLGEAGTDERRIGVGDLPYQELGPDRDDFDDQFPGSQRPNFQLGSPGTMVPSN